MQYIAQITHPVARNIERKLPEAWRGKEISRYDFSSSGRLAYTQTRILQKVNEAVAELLAGELGKLFRTQAEVMAHAPRGMDLAEINKQLRPDGVFAAFSCGGEQSIAALGVDCELALHIVDRILGGSGAMNPMRRRLTELERHIVSEEFEIILSQYAQGWAQASSFAPKLLETWSGNLPEWIIAKTEGAAVSDFEVKLNGLQGIITFYLLLPECESLFSKAVGPKSAADGVASKAEERSRVMQAIEEIELPLSAVLGKGKISLADLMGIAEGDVIRLEAKQSEEVELWADGRAEFLAKPLLVNGQMAMGITEELNRGGA